MRMKSGGLILVNITKPDIASNGNIYANNTR